MLACHDMRSARNGDYDAVSIDVEGAKKDAHTGANGTAPDAAAKDAGANSPSPAAKQAPATIGALLADAGNSGLVRCMLLDFDAIRANHTTLKAMAEFGSLMIWYFVCDRTPLIGEGEKEYNRDLFAFLFLILTCVAFGSSLQSIKVPVLLNRQQTEEWKGWMQVRWGWGASSSSAAPAAACSIGGCATGGYQRDEGLTFNSPPSGPVPAVPLL